LLVFPILNLVEYALLVNLLWKYGGDETVGGGVLLGSLFLSLEDPRG
jgi:hypothetical protein